MKFVSSGVLPIAGSEKIHGIQVNDSVHAESTPEQSEFGSFLAFKSRRNQSRTSV
jgi:hypothetical protein